jgi:DNA-binding PadR family transcriptional regulator
MAEVKIFNAESKRKFYFFSIIKRLHAGDQPYNIYKAWSWNRTRLTYWINRIEKAGLIKQIARTNIAIYQITEQGKIFYNECMQQLPLGQINLHNVAWTYDMAKEGAIPIQKTWNAGTTTFKLARFRNVTAVWNYKSLTLHVANLLGNDAFVLEDKAKNIVLGIAEQLKSAGFELSNPRLSRKPHFAIIDPIATQVAKSMELRTEVMKIDASEGYGEAEFFTPEGAANYYKAITSMANILPKLNQNIELEIYNKQLHQKVLEEMLDTLKQIKEKIGDKLK